MPGRTAKVTITERQQDILHILRNAPTASSQLRQRAAIVLLAFQKRGNREIATEVGLSRRPVSTWRRRWADAWNRLNQIETIFGVIMRKVIRRGSFTSVADLRSKLLNFIGYFNEVFAKPFHWTYTSRPLRVAVVA